MSANRIDNLSHEVREAIYTAARDGMAIFLYDMLTRIRPHEMHDILINQGFPTENGQCLSPFMAAAFHGQTNVLKMLLEKFRPDVENECPVIFDGTLIEGATALWCAAGGGHLDCVKVLVHAKANVNHWTKTHSTPVRAACFIGRMDIIKYLVARGAFVAMPNVYNNTCLMIAAHRGHAEVVEYLLADGMDVNKQSRCGATALHYAAESGQMEICEMLLNDGAAIKINEYGLTPVLLAAEKAHSSTVSVFLDWPELLTKEEKIEALELLGASIAASEKDSHSLSRAFTYLLEAMEMRHELPDAVFRKTLGAPIAAYDNWVECQTVAEVQAIRYNSNSMYMEALAIRERILGRKFPDLVSPVIYQGAVCADHGRFDRCENLWHHALFLRQSNGVPVARDLQRFAQLFAQMHTMRFALRLPSLITVLSSCVVEMARTTKRINAIDIKVDNEEIIEEVDSNILSTLYLICLVTKVLKTRKPVDQQDLKSVYKLVREVISMDMRLRDGQTLLHLAVNACLPVDEFRTRDLCGFPCPDTVKLLLHCGAPANDVDFDRNSVLHILLGTMKDPPSRHMILTLEYILSRLISAGAHVDAVNEYGITARESTNSKLMQNIVRTYEVKETRLACLAARRIGRNRIEFKGVVPRHLEPFIEMHCSGLLSRSD